MTYAEAGGVSPGGLSKVCVNTNLTQLREPKWTVHLQVKYEGFKGLTDNLAPRQTVHPVQLSWGKAEK